MKKPPSKLELRTQTIRELTGEALTRAVGGSLQHGGVVVQGFIMKDSIIVRTSG